MDPMLEQFCRAHRREDVRPDWFSQFQRYLASVVQPQLNQLDAALLENEKLREELAVLRAGQPEKRKRGRPRKATLTGCTCGADMIPGRAYRESHSETCPRRHVEVGA